MDHSMNTPWQTLFESHTPKACGDLTQLPSSFLAPLPSFTVITMQGEESEKYLQGQVTADVETLNNGQWSLAAHCDAKGKTWATYFAAKQNASNFTLLTTESASSQSLPELTKFSVFSQTEITQSKDDLAFYLYSDSGMSIISTLLPDTNIDTNSSQFFISTNTIKLLSLDTNRYILIIDQNTFQTLVENHNLPLITEDAFYFHETLAARPSLVKATSQQFVPQMLNLQALHAISFTKGCYIGQETVARMRYLGKNKRATYLLKAESVIEPLTAGDNLQRALGENWRNTGVVLQCVSDKTQTFILAVLPNDITADDVIRCESSPNVTITQQQLPYSLSDE